MTITLLCLFFAALITSMISGTIGMAGGVLLLSAMTFFISIDVIVPIHGMVQLASNSTRFFLLRKHLRKNLITSFSIGVPIGALGSTYLITKIDQKQYFFIAIAFIIFFALFKPKKVKFNLPDNLFILIGIAVGFLGLFVGATGPFIAPFFLNSKFTKEEVVANKAAVQAIGHLVKIPAFLTLGFNYQSHLILIILLIIGTFIGTHLGVKLLGKINERVFTIFFKTALFFSALRLLLQ